MELIDFKDYKILGDKKGRVLEMPLFEGNSGWTGPRHALRKKPDNPW